jgi:hypothetical protein
MDVPETTTTTRWRSRGLLRSKPTSLSPDNPGMDTSTTTASIPFWMMERVAPMAEGCSNTSQLPWVRILRNWARASSESSMMSTFKVPPLDASGTLGTRHRWNKWNVCRCETASVGR